MKSKIDWKRKLTSRKFWLAVSGLAVAIVLLIFNAPDLADRVSCVILAVASVVSYIIGEGLTDAAAAKNEETHKETHKETHEPTYGYIDTHS